jgi:hypothetical protein
MGARQSYIPWSSGVRFGSKMRLSTATGRVSAGKPLPDLPQGTANGTVLQCELGPPG